MFNNNYYYIQFGGGGGFSMSFGRPTAIARVVDVAAEERGRLLDIVLGVGRGPLQRRVLCACRPLATSEHGAEGADLLGLGAVDEDGGDDEGDTDYELRGDPEVEEEPRAEASDDDGEGLREVAEDVPRKLHDDSDDHAAGRVGKDGGPHDAVEAVERRAVLDLVLVVNEERADPGDRDREDAELSVAHPYLEGRWVR